MLDGRLFFLLCLFLSNLRLLVGWRYLIRFLDFSSTFVIGLIWNGISGFFLMPWCVIVGNFCNWDKQGQLVVYLMLQLLTSFFSFFKKWLIYFLNFQYYSCHLGISFWGKQTFGMSMVSGSSLFSKLTRWSGLCWNWNQGETPWQAVFLLLFRLFGSGGK